MHGFGLTDHALGEAFFHPKQLVFFAFEHLVDRHTGPARYHLRDVIGRDGLLHHLAGVFLGFDLGKPLLQLGNSAIGQFACALIFAAALGVGEFDAQGVEFALEFLRVR